MTITHVLSVSLVPADAMMHEINALVPCCNLWGYRGTLLSMTRGTAQYMMAFSHYEQAPPAYRGPDDDNFPPAIGIRA
jgi:translation elongation factor EF-G